MSHINAIHGKRHIVVYITHHHQKSHCYRRFVLVSASSEHADWLAMYASPSVYICSVYECPRNTFYSFGLRRFSSCKFFLGKRWGLEWTVSPVEQTHTHICIFILNFSLCKEWMHGLLCRVIFIAFMLCYFFFFSDFFSSFHTVFFSPLFCACFLFLLSFLCHIWLLHMRYYRYCAYLLLCMFSLSFFTGRSSVFVVLFFSLSLSPLFDSMRYFSLAIVRKRDKKRV